MSTLARAGIVAISALTAVIGCRTIPPDNPTKPSMMPGGNKAESRARRTAANRPKPWVEEKRPFDSDRIGLAPHRAQYDGRKEPGAPSQSTCARFVESYPCPLLAHRWRIEDQPRGVKLSVTASRLAANKLRDALRCHYAYGRSRHEGHSTGCLRRFLDARLAGGYTKKGVMTLQITAKRGLDAAGVKKLRARVRTIVEAAH